MKYTSYLLIISLAIFAGCANTTPEVATNTANINTAVTVPTETLPETTEPIVAQNTNSNTTVDISEDTIDTPVEEPIVEPTPEPKKSGFTLAEVSEHASRTDCWMAIEGTVYDVTDYIGSHPGGAQILQGCGKDATTLFQTQGGEGSHSGSARSTLDSYQIAPLVQ